MNACESSMSKPIDRAPRPLVVNCDDCSWQTRMDAGYVRDCASARARFGAEDLCVPRLACPELWFPSPSNGRVGADRKFLVLVFENFDAQAVRRMDIGLIGPRSLPLPGCTGTPATFHLETALRTFRTLNPTWLTTVPCCASGRSGRRT